jgi:hypothetical protein
VILNACFVTKTQKKYVEEALSQLQKKVLCIATGAFWTTALSVLEVEIYTLPVLLQLLQVSVNTALRIKEPLRSGKSSSIGVQAIIYTKTDSPYSRELNSRLTRSLVQQIKLKKRLYQQYYYSRPYLRLVLQVQQGRQQNTTTGFISNP